MVVLLSSLVVQGFKNTVLKSVKVIQKEGKKPLVFVCFMDFDTFEDTGDLIFVKENLTVDDLANLKVLEKKQVKATIVPNTYNGKTSFIAVDIVKQG